MSPTEAIPLLIVVLLMISIGGADVEQMSVTFRGEHDAGGIQEVHVVAGGTTTVPENTSVAADIDGDVTLLAGNVSVVDDATVTGAVQTYGGESAVADGATVGHVSAFEPPVPSDSPARRIGTLVLQFVVLAVVGLWLVRRHPLLLDNVGHAIANHPLVSGVTGALGALTLLVLFVYMAFTLILIPLTIVGLVGELLVVFYGQVAFGHLIGTRLPIDRADLATVTGIGLFLLFIELLGTLPYLGALVQLGLLAVGFGAVLNTYFGLQRFEPVTISGGTD